MTEKRTLALSTRQWRVLLHDNLDVLKAAVQQTESLSEEGLKTFCAQLDDMRMLAGAWFQVSVPIAAQVQEAKDADAMQSHPPSGNGATPPRKRRGRPSNAELAARQAVQ